MNLGRLGEFLQYARKLTNVQAEELLEKDFYITLMLFEIRNNAIHENLAFKGGTCLSKAYLDHYRLSEDIDFNWVDRKEFENLSSSKMKKICSEKIGQIAEIFEVIAKKHGLDFKAEKNNNRFIQLSSNGKQVTFKIWYASWASGTASFIKIQVSFIEPGIFPIKNIALKPIFNIKDMKNEDRVYFEEFVPLYAPGIEYKVLDIREIFAEKIRALLTRKRIKTRDLVDVYFINKKFGLDMAHLHKECMEKLTFAIDNYDKYRKNFEDVTMTELTKERLQTEDFKILLLVKIDEQDFDAFTQSFLKNINIFIKNVKEVIK